jgi:ATP-dependent DNA ligase
MQLCKNGKVEDIKKYQEKRWIAELKLDGVRVNCSVKLGIPKIVGRRGTCYNSQFPGVLDGLKDFPDCVLDGEIVTSDFVFNHVASVVHTQNKTMLRALNNKYKPKLFIFDVLEVQNEDLRKYPLEIRRKVLEFLMRYRKENVQILDFTDDIETLWLRVVANNQEGIIVKNPKGLYEETRSWNWIKIKNFKEKEIVVNSFEVNPAGITASNGTHRIQISGNQCNEVRELIQTCGSATINVQYLEETKNGQLRFPSFRGLV